MANNMIIIMKSRQEIAGLEIANSKLENCVICQLIFSNEIFRKARQILMPNSECNFWAVKVVDKDEKVLFYLRYEEDILDSYVVETNYQGEKLMNIVKNLDLDIIENYDKFVFADLDEYTYAIAELVLEYYRDKQIVFIEPFAELFFDDHRVVCINKVDYCADNNRIMYVSSKAVRYDVRPFTDKQISLFSSIMVIANLCWACRRQSKGTLNKDKTVVIVDYEPKLKMGGMGGMNAIISDVLFYCSKIRQKGWIPVVHLTNTQYSSDLIEDSWGYYFKSLSDVTYEDAMQSAHVIDGRENNFTWTPGRILLDAHLQDQFNVELSIQMQEYINEKTPYQFKENKRILGVIARGSDLKKATKSEFAIDDFVQIIKEQFESQYDYIFLATEESEYLEKFIAQFNEKLIYIKQTRIGYDYNNEKYKLIAEVLNLQGSQKTEFGRKYLLITYLLSQCNSLYLNP